MSKEIEAAIRQLEMSVLEFAACVRTLGVSGDRTEWLQRIEIEVNALIPQLHGTPFIDRNFAAGCLDCCSTGWSNSLSYNESERPYVQQDLIDCGELLLSLLYESTPGDNNK